MPTYEYACKECGEHLEVVQSFSDDTLTECPNCKGELRKVFGNIGVSFKGSGFYKTDSRASASKSRSSSETTSTDTPTKSAEAPAPAKTDTTKPPASSDKAAS